MRSFPFLYFYTAQEPVFPSTWFPLGIESGLAIHELDQSVFIGSSTILLLQLFRKASIFIGSHNARPPFPFTRAFVADTITKGTVTEIAGHSRQLRFERACLQNPSFPCTTLTMRTSMPASIYPKHHALHHIRTHHQRHISSKPTIHTLKQRLISQ